MSAISRYNPFEQITLRCPLSLSDSTNPHDRLHTYTFTPCNEAELRLRCWDRICSQLESTTERPGWLTEEGQIIFDQFVRDPQAGISSEEAGRIQAGKGSCQLLTGDGKTGYLSFEGLHGARTWELQNLMASSGSCHICRTAFYSIHQSVYLNRFLTLGTFEYKWEHRVQNLTIRMQECIRPFQELWEGYIAGDDPQTLRSKCNACFHTLDIFVVFGEKILLSLLGSLVGLKVLFGTCRCFGFKGVDPILLKINQSFDWWMQTFAAPLLTWEFARQTSLLELKLLIGFLGAGFAYLALTKRAHIL